MKYKINGKRVREIRLFKKISQTQLAEQSELSFMTIRRIEESGKNNASSCLVRLRSVEKIAKCLNIPYQELVSEETFNSLPVSPLLLTQIKEYVSNEFSFEINDNQIVPFLFGRVK
tara:strand:+ start:61 stop:408 length:348 start_codon:yes stop_codon:yes gene_type:complete